MKIVIIIMMIISGYPSVIPAACFETLSRQGDPERPVVCIGSSTWLHQWCFQLGNDLLSYHLLFVSCESKV